ncbi:MAG: WecB/TagA/CpsF family glycosyltransferase [Hyphomicrobium sp.]|nr:WecB/TagA/CpsF family glycosyltransferase [Hyphomicrobium sp.]
MSEDAHATPILGVPVSSIDMSEAVSRIIGWARQRQSRYVCACDVHSLMRARSDTTHYDALRLADMITPDGQPLVWTARMRGDRRMGRVSGPDLMPAVCEASAGQGLRHYFYGGAEGVAAAVAERLKTSYPALEIAGAESPPFRPLTQLEERSLEERLADARVDIIWIGLGCPKQERWMLEHVSRIRGVVMIGVGAAFDFQSDRIRRAPLWMRNHGLEWLHRLFSEPRRLWHRYVVLAPIFAIQSVAETFRLGLPRPEKPAVE